MYLRDSQTQLSDRLARAAKQITVGARYVHYKQRTYKVIALALREEDNEPCVIYQAEYGDHIIWMRPVAGWLEKVEFNGIKVDRFALLS